MSDSNSSDVAFGNAISEASEKLFGEVRSNVAAGVYSEEEGSRIIMGAAMFLIRLGDALGEADGKLKNPFLDLH